MRVADSGCRVDQSPRRRQRHDLSPEAVGVARGQQLHATPAPQRGQLRDLLRSGLLQLSVGVQNVESRVKGMG